MSETNIEQGFLSAPTPAEATEFMEKTTEEWRDLMLAANLSTTKAAAEMRVPKRTLRDKLNPHKKATLNLPERYVLSLICIKRIDRMQSQPLT